MLGFMRDQDTSPRPAADMVRAQWTQVERLERLPVRDAQSLLAADLRQAHRDATAYLPELRPWPKLPKNNLQIYRSSANQIRVWRVCRFLSSEDRILDIGMGHGWLPGTLSLAVQPQAYIGVDVSDSKFDSVREMAKVNGIDASQWSLGIKDLYELDAEWVGHHNPSIVLLLEVLEHLPDPQQALTVIANAISPSTQLLFSIPMLGRVEACWGHVSLFDANRVRQLCENAGLTVHWVEPVANTWQFLLVSRSSRRPERVTRLAENPPSGVPAPTRGDARLALPSNDDPTFHRVRLGPASLANSEWTTPQAECQVTSNSSGGVRLDAQNNGGPLTAKQYAGLAFPVDGLQVLRIELTVSERARVSRLIVEGRDSRGHRTVRWDLGRTRLRGLSTEGKTYVLRPGVATAGFKPVDASDPGATRVVEIVAQLKRRSNSSLVLRRAAYVR
jgi:2-polyprenyl-3-methyl-5-hydroxy-6-metoxy-1,4-benzoquinol methylase